MAQQRPAPGSGGPFDPRRPHVHDFVAWETQLSPRRRSVAVPLIFGLVGSGALSLLLFGAPMLGGMALAITLIIAILWGGESRGRRTR